MSAAFEETNAAIVKKLSRLNAPVVKSSTQLKNCSAKEIVTILYFLAERWDVACCKPNCTKTSEKFQCVKTALRHMDCSHLEPPITKIKTMKKFPSALKAVLRVVECMLTCLEDRYPNLYKRKKWPTASEMEIEKPPSSPIRKTSQYNMNFTNFGADDVPPMPSSTNQMPGFRKELEPKDQQIAANTPKNTTTSNNMNSLNTAMVPEINTYNSPNLNHNSKFNHQDPSIKKNLFNSNSSSMQPKQQNQSWNSNRASQPMQKQRNGEVISSGFCPVSIRQINETTRSLQSLKVSTRHTATKKRTSHMFDSSRSQSKRSSKSKNQNEKVIGQKRSRESSNEERSRKRISVEKSNSDSRSDEISSHDSNHSVCRSLPEIENKIIEKEIINYQNKNPPNPPPSPPPPSALLKNQEFERNLEYLANKSMTQIIELIGIEQDLINSKYGTHIIRIFDGVFARLQDYGVEKIEDPKRFLWKIIKPIPTKRWNNLKFAVQLTAEKIACACTEELEPLLRKATQLTRKHIDIQDHEF